MPIKPASRENYRMCPKCSEELEEEVLYHVKALETRGGFFTSETQTFCPRNHVMPDAPAPAAS